MPIPKKSISELAEQTLFFKRDIQRLFGLSRDDAAKKFAFMDAYDQEDKYRTNERKVSRRAVCHVMHMTSQQISDMAKEKH